MIRVKGAEQLMRKLERLSYSGSRRAQVKATRAAGRVLLKAVRSEVPVDEGQLRAAQASKVVGSSRAQSMGVIVGADVDRLESDSAASGTTEAGTPLRPTNIDHLVNNGHVSPDGKFVPPAGYMENAAARAMPAAEAAYTTRLAQEIEREASK